MFDFTHISGTQNTSMKHLRNNTIGCNFLRINIARSCFSGDLAFHVFRDLSYIQNDESYM